MSLAAQLSQNYDKLIDDGCKDEVIRYLAEHETVLKEDVGFVKRLTKVADHILKSEPKALDGLLEKLVQFNNQGAFLCLDRGRSNFPEKYLRTMRSHFLGYAGDVALEIFKRTGDAEWAIQSYTSYKQSAASGESVDSQHAAYMYGFAGDVATQLNDMTERDRSWARKALECYRNYYRVYKKIGIENIRMRDFITYRIQELEDELNRQDTRVL